MDLHLERNTWWEQGMRREHIMCRGNSTREILGRSGGLYGGGSHNRESFGGGFLNHPPLGHGYGMHHRSGMGSSHYPEDQFTHHHRRGQGYGLHRQHGMHLPHRIGHHPRPYASDNHRNHIHERFPCGDFLNHGANGFGDPQGQGLHPREGTLGGPLVGDLLGRHPVEQVFGEYSDEDTGSDDVAPQFRMRRT